ncbi:hypothetical protein [Streptomyces sp. SID3343]|uniref:hypothetical protein n=1 Tax=Streptomyces sp. SID3343 TaxID=2690260 RepID=UPI00136F7339|nr:hypothetical protein [Streptomyces sp. SID3343]MYV96988.1 hypothetical protein [Streptomyces sp. SID3343]
MSNNAPGPWGPQPGQPQQPPPGQWGQQGAPGPFGSGPYGGPPPQPPRRQGNPGLGIVAGVAAMLVGAGVYGFVVKSLEIQSTWFGVGVAALIGFAVGRIGGRNPALPIVAVGLALVGIALGQMTAIVLEAADQLDVSAIEVVTDWSDEVFRSWKESMGFFDVLVLIFGGVAAFAITKNVAES